MYGGYGTKKKKQWVSLKYERLLNLCYWCGCLTHNDRDYESWIDSEGTLTTVDQQFRPWLHAAPYSRSQKRVITVPHFYKKHKDCSS